MGLGDQTEGDGLLDADLCRVIPRAYRVFRAGIIGLTPINWWALRLSSAVTLLVLASGALYFKRTERAFADVV